MGKGAVIWGSILILVGVLLILSNLGIITANIWGVIWAMLLIGLGLWFLLGSSSRWSGKPSLANIPFKGVAQARITFRHGAGRLHLQAGSETTDLLSGQFSGGVDISDRVVGDRQEVVLQVPGKNFPFGWFPGGALDWTIAIKRGTPLELIFETGAAETDLDLTDLFVTVLRLSTGASANHIRLPANAGSSRVELKAGAATIELRVPPGVAGRIRSSSGLATLQVDTRRFPRQVDRYQSADYDTASNRVDIMIESGLATTEVR